MKINSFSSGPFLAVAWFVWGGFSDCERLAAQPAGFPSALFQATEPLAWEPGNHAGMISIRRATQDSSMPLTVSYFIGGTASNGVDYEEIPASVTLAAGQESTNLLITPIAEPSAKGHKTVIVGEPLIFGPPPRPPIPGPILPEPIIFASEAVVYIVYNYTNAAPTVKITEPAKGARFLSLPNISITARAGDKNGWVSSVEFFANGASIGVATNEADVFPPLPPLPVAVGPTGWQPPIELGHSSDFTLLWTNVAAGPFELTAVATDNAGLQATSAAVNITVTNTHPVPRARWLYPREGARLPEGAAINLLAAAGERAGVIKTVEFFAGGTSLGIVTNAPWPAPSPPLPAPILWGSYYFQWTNAPVGTNVLTAVATDNNAIMATSAAISIQVVTNLHRHHP